MEPPEPYSVIEPILPERNVLSAITSIVPEPLYKKVTEWFGGEKKLTIYVAATVAAVGAIKLVGYIKESNLRKKWNAVGKDVVVLHTLRGKSVPSPSPFCLKLETYLKLADIKYEVDTEKPNGPKGKFPWITLNGEGIGDSQMIIELLNKKFTKDLDTHLTPEQKSIGRAMRIMLEEHFLWCWEIWFFLVDDLKSAMNMIEMRPAIRLMYHILAPFLKSKIRKVTYTVGIGRHTNEEIEKMGKQDITVLSSCLGNKKFFMGDKPTEADCTIFGFLATILWNTPDSPYAKLMKGECDNLVSYCDRMKETVWPDWDECLQKTPY